MSPRALTRAVVYLVWPKASRERTLAVRIVDSEMAVDVDGRVQTWFLAEHA